MLIATGHWKGMKNWIGTNNLVVVSLICAYYFSKSTKRTSLCVTWEHVDHLCMYEPLEPQLVPIICFDFRGIKNILKISKVQSETVFQIQADNAIVIAKGQKDKK